MTLRTLNYGNYGIFLIMGHAGFCPSTVVEGISSFDRGSRMPEPNTLWKTQERSNIHSRDDLFPASL